MLYIQIFLETSPPEPPAWLCPGPAEGLTAPTPPPPQTLTYATHVRYALCADNVLFTNIEVSTKISVSPPEFLIIVDNHKSPSTLN